MDEWRQTLDDDAREYYEERAAMMEFDGGLPRAEAELAAKALTEAYLERRDRK